jgi:predicted permease
MSLTNRLMNLFRREKLNAEINEELRFHVEARIRDNLAGAMLPSEAQQDAARRFGGQLLSKEGSREADVVVWLETIGQDVHYAIRSLRKTPGVTAVAAVSLALAIGANTAIFSIVNAVLLRSLPYTNADRLAILWSANLLTKGAREQRTSIPNFEDWKSGTHAFEDMAMYRDADGTLVGAGFGDVEPEWIEYAWVSDNFFHLLGRNPAIGRVFTPDEFDRRKPLAVLSHRLWERRFRSSSDVIGKVLNVAGVDFQVIGVMPEDFKFLRTKMVLWVPASVHPEWQSRHANRKSRFGTVFGRLRPELMLEQANVEMSAIARRLERQYPESNANEGISIVPLQAQINGKTVPFMLAVLFGAVMFVLLIACANIANLLLARGASRRREIALRTALGAGRGRIVRQLITESMLLSCVAGCLSLPVLAWSVRALIALAPPDIARLDEVHIDVTVLIFTVVP